MKQYGKIPYYGDHWGIPIVAFDKLDGSNLRFEFSRKKGFYKFGSRTELIDNSKNLGVGIEIFINKYAEGIQKVFNSPKYKHVISFVCYAEFLGKKSEFGYHDFANDEFDIVLIDVDQYKKGFVHPKSFIDDFGHLGIPKVIYKGELNEQFVADVKENKFLLSEGVICKSVLKTKKGLDSLYYCKIKTVDWLTRLKEKNPALYIQELQEIVSK